MRINGKESDDKNRDLMDFDIDDNTVQKGPKFIKDVAEQKAKADTAEDKVENSAEYPIDTKNSDTTTKLNGGEDKENKKNITINKKMVSLVSLVLAAVFLVLTLVFGIKTIGSWWSHRGMMKDINNNYDTALMENKVYTRIDIITANVLSYADGICTTDLGDIECNKPSGTVMMVFYDLEGNLRPIDTITSGNGAVEYVTESFTPPDNAMVIFSDNAKDTYSDYLIDLEEAEETHASMKSSRTILLGSVVAALAFGVTGILTRPSIGFNTGNIKKARENGGNHEDKKEEC